MNAFLVLARGEYGSYLEFGAIALSSFDAAIYAAELFGDEPCGITVMAVAQ